MDTTKSREVIYDFLSKNQHEHTFELCIKNPLPNFYYPLLYSIDSPQFYFVDLPLNKEECILISKEKRIIVGYFKSDDINNIDNLSHLEQKWS